MKAPAAPSTPDRSGSVTLDVVHERSLVGRLAVLLNAHDVTTFTYHLDPVSQLARVEVVVAGGDQQVARVAHRLRRVIGVQRVCTRPPAAQ